MTARTREVIEMDIRYAIRLNELHRRLYRKSKYVIALASLLGGSAAIASILRPSPALTTVASVLVSVAAAADIVFDLSERAARRTQLIRAYWGLLNGDSSDAELQRGLQTLYSSIEDSDIESLRTVAFHDNVRAMGWDHQITPEGVWTRVMRVLS